MKTVVNSVRLCLGAFLWLMLVGPVARGQAPAWQVAIADCRTANNYYNIYKMLPDNNGNIYITGDFAGTVAFGSTVLSNPRGDRDIFLTKWNASTGQFAWAVQAGGIDLDYPSALALSGSNIYLTGTFRQVAAFGTTTLTASGLNEAFIAKITDTGQFVWSKQMGGQGVEHAGAVEVNGSNVYVAGDFTGASASLGALSIANTGPVNSTTDAFVAKISDAGSTATFDWVQQIGGAGNNGVSSLATVGNALYAAGTFSGVSATIGAATLTNAGAVSTTDIFVVRLADVGSNANTVWAMRAGGSQTESCTALSASNNSLYLAGSFDGAAATFGVTSLSSAGGLDVFVAKMNDIGTTGTFAWAASAGGASNEFVSGLASVGSDVYVTGWFGSGTALFGTTVLAAVGPAQDWFAAKLTDNGTTGSFTWAQHAHPTNGGATSAVTASGRTVYVAGHAYGPMTFDSQTLPGAQGGHCNYLAHLNDSAYPPRLTSFSPAAGMAGTTVTLTGTNFTNAAGVSFNGIAAPGFTVNTAGNSLTVAVPAGASSGLLRVSTPGGTAISSTAFTVQTGLGTVAAAASALLLSPNPAHHTATVVLPTETAFLTLCDDLGRVVRTFVPDRMANGTPYSMNLTGLVPGLYLLRAGAAHARLVVE